METLFQKLVQTIQSSKNNNKKDAELIALKEIVFSGLSRSGILKAAPYLPEFDRNIDNVLYLSFISPDSSIESFLDEAKKTVKNELDAAGTKTMISGKKSGFRIETGVLSIYILIFIKNYGFKPLISYQQIPLPYEIRSIRSIPDELRSEIQNLIEKEIHKESSQEKKKKKSAKNSESDRKKETDNIQQLSLFDF